MNCVRETTNYEDPYAVAVMHYCRPCTMQDVSCLRSVFKMLALSRAYALKELCAWVLQNTSCFITGEIKFGRCFAIHQTAKFKSLPNFLAIRYSHMAIRLAFF